MAVKSTNGIPMLGLGTFGRTGGEGLEALLAAIEIGYRHIDTAQSYGTEENVGEAVRRSGLPRGEIFITTKVADTNLGKDEVLPSIEKSLETLGVDTIDLLLIHWPSKDDAVPFEDYMLKLAEAKERGFAQRIGVSNYPVADLQRAEALLGRGALATNQVELHVYLQSPKLSAHAKAIGMPLTAYRPLAKAAANDDATLKEIAGRHGVTAAAVALAFLMAEGHIVIPASGNPARLAANFAAHTVALAADEVAAIRTLDRGERGIDPDKAPAWDDGK
ncbi:MAG: 2,5-didehydrogluconate reductase DkgB [Acuticoccus sp.]